MTGSTLISYSLRNLPKVGTSQLVAEAGTVAMMHPTSAPNIAWLGGAARSHLLRFCGQLAGVGSFDLGIFFGEIGAGEVTFQIR
jgi:hypothetical protein